MARIDPPFQAPAWTIHTAEPPLPYEQREGRMNIYDTENMLPSEDLEAFLQRGRDAAAYWFKEDAEERRKALIALHAQHRQEQRERREAASERAAKIGEALTRLGRAG